jgi:polyhydroxybutyrate depolymerase
MRLWLGLGVLLTCLACGWPGGGRRGPPDGKGDVSRGPKGEWLEEIHVQSGGLDRTALLHVPAGATGPMPLLVLFHGGQGVGGDDGTKMAARWDHMHDQGFAMVFPNAVGDGDRAWAGPDDKRDLNFTNDLIDDVMRRVKIDPNKIYAAGFSNGSGMVWMLQCLATDRFAGFGHAEQAMAEQVLRKCKPTKHVPTIYFHGDADPKAEWDGNNGTIGVPRTMDFVLDYHRCTGPGDVSELPDLPNDETRVTRTLYRNCKDVPAIELFRIHGGKHHWPAKGKARQAEGRCSDVDASEEMVQFWKTYAGM